MTVSILSHQFGGGWRAFCHIALENENIYFIKIKTKEALFLLYIGILKTLKGLNLGSRFEPWVKGRLP